MAKSVIALKNGDFQYVPDTDIRYVYPNPSNFFGNAINLIPLQNAVSIPRAFYGEKFQNQALPIENPDEPYVQHLYKIDDKGNPISFDQKMGKSLGAVFSDYDGVVDKLDDDSIVIRSNLGNTKKYNLYKNFPFNRKTYINNTPLVKVGDKVTKGMVLAKSNYTNDKGTMAFGKNARVGLVPYLGYSTDDAIVISQSFANKLKSDHMYSYDQTSDKGADVDKNKFLSLFGDKFNRNQIDNIGDNGVIKPGSIVLKDDPLILSVSPKRVNSSAGELGNLSKYLNKMSVDSSTVWDHDNPGIVTSAVKGKNGWKVNVQTLEVARPGDKISFRAGQKSTISKIIPDDEMPYTSDGKPLDVLLNPLSIPSRINDSTVFEILLGKVAEKTGKAYKLDSFKPDGDKWINFVRDELKKNNLSETEEVFDPKLNRWLDNPITTGNAYILKLHHTGSSKLSSRAQGSYDLNFQQPKKGGGESEKAKRISGLETYALLSAGAYGFLNDAMNVRGQKNDEYWRSVRMGASPDIQRKSPYSWDKYIAVLSGTGIYPKALPDGKMRLGPFTDKILNSLDPIEIKKGDIVDNQIRPIKDGLFDSALTVTNKWGKISLPQKFPNPAFEPVIRDFLSLSQKDFNAVLSGNQSLGNYGTGPSAIGKALSNLNVDDMKLRALETIKNGPKTKKPKAVKVLNAIQGLEKNNVSPSDLMISAVPVIPAQFRPYALVGDTFIPGDANELYKELIHVRDNYNDAKNLFDESDLKEEGKALYDSIKAAYGFGEPVGKKLRQRQVSGFMHKLTGDTSKFSSFQRNLISKPQDFSARGVVDVDPSLGFDQIGLPKEIAWPIYSPWVINRMVKSGYTPMDATKLVADRDPIAYSYLEGEIKDRPVYMNRAPTWHKQNGLGLWVKLHDGKNILTSPLYATGLNMDYDGDTVNIHVPATKEAIEDLKTNLMPSKGQILSIKDKETPVNVLKHEYLLGLYNAKKTPGRTYTFNTEKEALEAIKSGKIKLSDEVNILYR